MKLMCMMLSLTMVASCGDDDDPIAGITDTGESDGGDEGSNDTSGELVTISAPDFSGFSIAQSTASTGETTAEPASRAQSVTVTFKEDGTAETSDANLVTISGQAVTASTAGVNYILTGSTAEGSSAAFNYKGTGDCTITLNGVSLNTVANAIGATTGGNVELVVNGSNSITATKKKAIEVGDDTEGSEIYQKLDIYGSGVLSVTAAAKGAISSTDAMTVNKGVVLNVTVGADATGKKGIKSDVSIDFRGGRTTVVNSAPATWDDTEGDYSAATCVKAPAVSVSGGTVQCLATGNGGKGIRADNTMTVSDGAVEVITTGSNLVRVSDADKVVTMSQLDSYSSYEDANPKGIHVGDKDATPATGNLTISGGKVKVKAVNSEGIESKMYMTFTGGTVEAYSGDDAINVGISSENNTGNAYAGKGKIDIRGGRIFAFSTDNDAIDANGTISISGGVVVASGNTAPECGFDCDQSTFAITGGYVFGIGGDTSSPTESSCTQPSLITSMTVSEGDVVTLQAGGTTVLKAEMPRSYSSARVLVSTPEMKKGASYALLRGGSTAASGSLSSSQYVNGSAGGSGGGGGFMPGPGRP